VVIGGFVRKCEYPGCVNRAASKGVRNGVRRYRPWCYKHKRLNPYQADRQKKRPGSKVRRERFPNGRCEECGVEGANHRHRIEPIFGYRLGNVRILCGRHHVEAHER
jgi:hypothetical protein